MADGSPTNGYQRAHCAILEKAPTRHVAGDHEKSQMCQTGEVTTTSAVGRLRGTHALDAPEIHEMTNFAPIMRQPNSSIQQPLPLHGNRDSSPRDGNVEEQDCINQGFEPPNLSKATLTMS